jgi:hypothetical protein
MTEANEETGTTEDEPCGVVLAFDQARKPKPKPAKPRKSKREQELDMTLHLAAALQAQVRAQSGRLWLGLRDLGERQRASDMYAATVLFYRELKDLQKLRDKPDE